MGEVSKATTNASGSYTLNEPGSGPYLIRVTHQGARLLHRRAAGWRTRRHPRLRRCPQSRRRLHRSRRLRVRSRQRPAPRHRALLRAQHQLAAAHRSGRIAASKSCCPPKPQSRESPPNAPLACPPASSSTPQAPRDTTPSTFPFSPTRAKKTRSFKSSTPFPTAAANSPSIPRNRCPRRASAFCCPRA